MSVDQISKPGSSARGDARLVQYDEYIDRQVESTRRVVKLVDLATALVVLAGGSLAFLLAAAVVEHWVVPGGYSVLERALLFALLLAGVGYYSYRRLLPLVIRRVNPVYAAHAIEQTGPTLKNSLVNLLLFRQRRSEISDAVYRTLEEQAAHRLSRVPLDSAVDRSLLIRFGYFLLAIVALTAAYKVFSPKDPVIAAERVLMPWADIVPASRVNISDITPGRTTVARGEFVDVSAQVDGIDDDETVVLRYTTEDGQAVDKSVPMRLSKDKMRFEGRLPNESSPGGSLGLAQNLWYRIEAGDARSLDYAVKVVDAPSILVERVEYDYPEYTGFLDRKVESLGDIRAIEGTRIKIHARANGPLKSAHVDFDADGRRDVALRTGDAAAAGSFVLALREDRVTPEHASYVLRSANREGQPNRNPVKYSIEVQRDYSPETSIVMPKEKSLDVRLDETITIAVEASDPDFALAEVHLRGDVQGRSVADVPLLKQSEKRFSGRYEFTPGAHGLKAGDVVEYWVIASDNRTPSPNIGESAKQTFRIVSPNPADQPPPDRLAQRDPGKRGQPGEGEPQQGNDGQQGEGEKGGAQQDSGQQKDGQQRQQNDGQQAQRQRGNGQQGEGQPGEQQPQNRDAAQQDGQPDQGQQASQQEGQQAEGGKGQPNAGQESQDSQGSKGEQANNDGGKPNGGQAGQQPNAGGEQGEGQPNAGARQSGKADGRQAENQRPQQDQGGEGAPESGQGESQQGGEAGANGQREPGGDPVAQKNGEQAGDQRKGSQQQAVDSSERGEGQQPGEQESPVPSEGDNDGEAFERIQKHLQRNGELSDSASSGEKEPSTENQQQENEGEKTGAPQAGSEQNDGQQNEKNGAAEGDPQSQQKQSDRNAQQQKSAGERAEDTTKGTGADTKSGEQQEPKQQQGGEKQQQNESPGGQQTSTKGESGAGDEQKAQGSPNSQPEMKPSEKRQQQPSQDGQSNEQEPPAGARGKSESDSQGEQGGDRSGGGEEGGGQKSPRDGTGSAGQNQSADEGAGESSEKGAGNDSPNAGTDRVADGKTGQSSGETKGRGSKTRLGDQNEPAEKPDDPNAAPGAQGEKPMHREAPRAEDGAWEKGGAQSGKSENDGKKSDGEKGSSGKQAAQDQSEKQGTPQGTGTQSGSGGAQSAPAGSPPQVDPLAAGDDEANLEYARKQTDMVLNKLADQLKQKKVDGELLKQLGWSEEDLRRFVDRWQERKQAAKAGDNETGDAAKRELDDALRSLGLRPGQLRQGQVKDDSMRDLREGFRGPVPLEYQERLRAYNEGVSRGRPAEE